MARGFREGQWLILRRCLAIIRRVQQGPADWQGLVEAVLEQEGPAGYGQTEGKALHKRLHRDLDRIRRELGIQLYADRSRGEYVIREATLPLLDLPDEDLATLAWLEQTFDSNSPQHREVRSLLGRLRFYLAPERRLKLEQHRIALVVDLGQRDEDIIAPEVEAGLTRALASRRRVEFDYLSPQYEDGQPRRHVVDIFEPPYFDTIRGHYYLRGWCDYIATATGSTGVGGYIDYRLGRIRNLQLLSQKLPPSPPLTKQYTVTYWLAPEIARSGVSLRRRITIKRTEPQADQSMIVYGTTENIFWAVQELMHYRHNCRVLGGPEMLKEMQGTVQKMAQLYAERE